MINLSDGSCYAEKQGRFTGTCALDLFFSLRVHFWPAYGSVLAHTKEQRGNDPEAVI